MTRLRQMLCTAAAALALCSHHAVAQEVTVGIQIPLTGPLANFAGEPVRRGIDTALEEIRSSGMLGSLRLNTIIEDHGADKTQAITLLSRFANRNKAVLTIGPGGSAEGLAVAPVANDLKIPMIGIGVTDAITKAGPWSFKAFQGPQQVIQGIGKYAVEKLKVKNVFIVYMRDADAYVHYKNILSDIYKRNGISVVGEEGILTADTDFTALATKIAARNPDSIFLATLPELAANIVLQARQAGMSNAVKLTGGNALAAPQYVRIGGKAVEGTVFPADYFVDAPHAANQTFVKAFRARYASDPDQFSAVAYSAMKLAAHAIKQAGPNPTRESVRAALAGVRDLPTVMGNGLLSHDEQRNPLYGSSILVIKDGKATVAP